MPFHDHHRQFHHDHHVARHHGFHRLRRSALENAPEIASGAGERGGLASWYHGRSAGLTAAHRSLPFGTRVLVTNRDNGRAVVVRINDRGPFIRGRVIDLNRTAAVAIGLSGVSPVSLRRL